MLNFSFNKLSRYQRLLSVVVDIKTVLLISQARHLLWTYTKLSGRYMTGLLKSRK
jgi:hypothetical protein